MSRVERKYKRSPLFSLMSVRFGSCEVRRLSRELVTFNKLAGESRYHKQNELLHICLLNNKNNRWKRYWFQRWLNFNIIRLSKFRVMVWLQTPLFARYFWSSPVTASLDPSYPGINAFSFISVTGNPRLVAWNECNFLWDEWKDIRTSSTEFEIIKLRQWHKSYATR